MSTVLAPAQLLTHDVGVSATPNRRRLTVAYKKEILRAAERCMAPGEIAALLRREGLYSSHLATRRNAEREGQLAGPAAGKADAPDLQAARAAEAAATKRISIQKRRQPCKLQHTQPCYPERYDLPLGRRLHLLIAARPDSTHRLCCSRTALRMRFRNWLMVSTAVAALGCRRAEVDNSRFSGLECFRVVAAGPMSSRDSTNISTLYQHVRMDSTHVRWNSEVDSATRETRYLYLDSTVESWGYEGYWAKDA